MIVITYLERMSKKNKDLYPGNVFKIDRTKEDLGTISIVIKEEICVNRIIDFFCMFRFIDSDGFCFSSVPLVYYGDSNEMPKELKEAIFQEDLTDEQKSNFFRSLIKFKGDQTTPSSLTDWWEKIKGGLSVCNYATNVQKEILV